jgi:hypothetical protein
MGLLGLRLRLKLCRRLSLRASGLWLLSRPLVLLLLVLRLRPLLPPLLPSGLRSGARRTDVCGGCAGVVELGLPVGDEADVCLRSGVLGSSCLCCGCGCGCGCCCCCDAGV